MLSIAVDHMTPAVAALCSSPSTFLGSLSLEAWSQRSLQSVCHHGLLSFAYTCFPFKSSQHFLRATTSFQQTRSGGNFIFVPLDAASGPWMVLSLPCGILFPGIVGSMLKGFSFLFRVCSSSSLEGAEDRTTCMFVPSEKEQKLAI